MSDKKLTILPQLKYYQKLCCLLERVEKENPCDPDITSDQIRAYKVLNNFKENNIPEVILERMDEKPSEFIGWRKGGY